MVYFAVNFPNLHDDRAPLFGASHDVNDTFLSVRNSNEDVNDNILNKPIKYIYNILTISAGCLAK